MARKLQLTSGENFRNYAEVNLDVETGTEMGVNPSLEIFLERLNESSSQLV